MQVVAAEGRGVEETMTPQAGAAGTSGGFGAQMIPESGSRILINLSGHMDHESFSHE